MEGAIGFCVLSLSCYRYLGDGGTVGVKLCMMVHIGPRQKVSPFRSGAAGISKIPNFEPKFWPFNREYFENGIRRSVMSIIIRA